MALYYNYSLQFIYVIIMQALDEQFPVGSYIPHQCPHKFFKFHAAQNEKDDRFLFVSVESGEIQISANPKSCKVCYIG